MPDGSLVHGSGDSSRAVRWHNVAPNNTHTAGGGSRISQSVFLCAVIAVEFAWSRDPRSVGVSGSLHSISHLRGV
jgi:hypothetical protein